MFFASIITFLCSLLLTRLLLFATPWMRIIDEPNQRSLHTIAIPRTGGIAIVVTVYGMFFLLGSNGMIESSPMFF